VDGAGFLACMFGGIDVGEAAPTLSLQGRVRPNY
jgi:hypothetical protein